MDIDMGVVRGLLSATLLILFLGIWAWSFSRKRQVEFDAAANMPLEDDSRPPANSMNKEQKS